MSETLFTLPLPSSALKGVDFDKRPRRTYALVCCWDDLAPECLFLVFEDVQALKCTHHRACNLEQISQSYDRLVDVGTSIWLSEITNQLTEYRNEGEEPIALRHLMIYFDDGPCYEFICPGFRIEWCVRETASDQSAY